MRSLVRGLAWARGAEFSVVSRIARTWAAVSGVVSQTPSRTSPSCWIVEAIGTKRATESHMIWEHIAARCAQMSGAPAATWATFSSNDNGHVARKAKRKAKRKATQEGDDHRTGADGRRPSATHTEAPPPDGANG